jgi:hypothetical protein
MGKVKSKLNTNECEDEAWDGTREIEMNIEENKMESNQTEDDAEEEPNKYYSANRTSLVCT